MTRAAMAGRAVTATVVCCARKASLKQAPATRCWSDADGDESTMTERLYYNDPYQREFDATVVSVEPYQNADSPSATHAVRLDRTAFYPTTGGQPFDTGTLGTARVVDV